MGWWRPLAIIEQVKEAKEAKHPKVPSTITRTKNPATPPSGPSSEEEHGIGIVVHLAVEWSADDIAEKRSLVLSKIQGSHG